jgi:hypothetical protein
MSLGYEERSAGLREDCGARGPITQAKTS